MTKNDVLELFSHLKSSGYLPTEPEIQEDPDEQIQSPSVKVKAPFSKTTGFHNRK